VRDRDRRSIREFMEEEAKSYAAEKETKERPIREAEKQLKATHRELYSVQKQQVETGTDPDVWVDPATIGYTIPQSEADKFNAEQCRLFVQIHPEFYNSQRNIRTVIDYFTRNNINIISTLTLEKAVARLAEFRLLEERPAPVEPVVQEQQPLEVEPSKPETFIGIDPATGRDREYSPYEVDRMSADEYRRAFRITKSSLKLPTRNW
jgi:hypothetical protein